MDLIRYDLLTQDAMRQIVRQVMASVAREGVLPGEHHFLITFFTTYKGVKISSRLMAQYPQEMTVILQHQFDHLVVSDSQFEVSLLFGGTSERIIVPFDAITQFFDPSVNFGLKFEVLLETETTPLTSTATKAQTQANGGASETRTKRQSAPKGAGSEPQSLPPRTDDTKTSAKSNLPPADNKASDSKTAEVVSLDKFRKK